MKQDAAATSSASPSSPLFHRLLLMLAGLAWLVGAGGNLYAGMFLSDARVHPLDVMTPRTLWQALFLWGGWWLAVATLVLCLVVLLLTRQSRALMIALGASAVYAFPQALLALGIL